MSENVFVPKEAAENFAFPGRVAAVEPHGSGNIHRTYTVRCETGDGVRRFILQSMNRQVMPDPALLMDNIERVLSHLHKKVSDPRRRASMVRTLDDKALFADPCGGFWRAFEFIEGTVTYDVAETPEQAFEAAKAFGNFLSLLRDLPSGPAAGLPHFHDAAKRFLMFEKAAAEDRAGRAAGVGAEIDFILKRKAFAGVLSELFEKGDIPERMTHNDTKINNVLFDERTGEGLCVIDLDTVMPGLTLYDFGDLVRSAASGSAEDEKDMAKVAVRMPVFKALVRGFLEGSGDLLGKAERKLMALGARLIAFELGMRFLTDYLGGDVYFLTSREGQNLDRCRTQLRLAELIEEREDEMSAFAESL